jgi:hypothetical protein
MEGREKPRTDKYKEITNHWNHDELYAYITSGLGLRKFQALDFLLHRVYSEEANIT